MDKFCLDNKIALVTVRFWYLTAGPTPLRRFNFLIIGKEVPWRTV